jgi:RNA polymerase sigma factor (sigma-70 family)
VPSSSGTASEMEVLTSPAEGIAAAQQSVNARAEQNPTLSEDQLALHFTPRIRLFAARYLNDVAAADDVAQETLRRVVEAIRSNRIDKHEALPGFVFQTARNICMHWVRSASREKSAFTRLERESSEIDSGDALANLVSAERAEEVKRAIQQMDKTDRELLGMIYYKEISTDDIAVKLGLTVAAVRVRKHRALQRLGVLLGEFAGNELSITGTP